MSAHDDYIKEKEEINNALRVDGYHGFLSFDDDIFLLDYWESKQGLNYLVGISDIRNYESEDEFVHTLDQDFYGENQSHITGAFKRELQRLTKIWNSGGHPELNPPWYYIEWAISKKYETPWLKYAIEKGFYTPYTKVANNLLEKPLSNKERETLLVIIASLAHEAKVDISKTSKAGELIANMTQLIGAPIGATTIETHLKRISQVLASRAK